MTNRLANSFCLIGLLAVVSASRIVAESPRDTADRVEYGDPIKLGILDETINESSGLARSFTQPGTFWTHNDSGDDARLFWIDGKGKTLATYKIDGADSIDWEDICSYQIGDESFLIVGDVGDNGSRRSTVQLYVIREPMPDKRTTRGELSVLRKILVKYDKGPTDCESIAVDVTTKTIILLGKRFSLTSTVYELPLDGDENKKVLTAKSISTIGIAAPTAMDISSDGRRAVVLTYGHAFEFVRGKNESWKDAYSHFPRTIHLPTRRQGESICFGTDDRSLFLTSERESQPFWKIPVATRSKTNESD